MGVAAFRLPPASTKDVLIVLDTALTAPAAVEWALQDIDETLLR